MAGFHTKTFIKHDDYATPSYAWKNIKNFIPENITIEDPFYCDGQSGRDMIEIFQNNKIIHDDTDFFKGDYSNIGMFLSNPPYDIKKEIFTKLKEIDKPFIMICPTALLITQYIRKLFSDSDNPLQIIIPRKRIQFIKKINGVTPEDYKSKCNFDCFYYCYKMNLERDIIWLD